MSFRTMSRNLLIAASLLVIFAGILAAFAAGYVGELQRSSLDPEGSGMAQAELLEDVRRAAGYSGAAGVMESYAETRNADDLTRATFYIRQAEAAVNQYQSQDIDERQRQNSEKLQDTLARISDIGKILKEDVRPLPILQRLNGLVRQMEEQITTLHRLEVMARLDTASQVTAHARTVILVILFLLVAVLIGLAVLIRTRIQAPLEQLSENVHDVSVAFDTGTLIDNPIWGSERRDEVGLMARAADRLRRSIAQQARSLSKAPEGSLTVSLSGPSGHVLDQMLEKIRVAAEDLEKKGSALDTVGEAMAVSARSQSSKMSESLDALARSQKALSEAVSSSRSDFKSGLEVLSNTARHLQDADEEIRTSAGAMMDRLTERFDTFTSKTEGGIEKVQASLRTMSSAQEEMSALTEETRKSSEHFAEFMGGAKDQVAQTLGAVQSQCSSFQGAVSDAEKEVREAAGKVQTHRDSIEATVSSTQAAAEQMAQSGNAIGEMIKTSMDDLTAAHGGLKSVVEAVTDQKNTFDDVISTVTTSLAKMTKVTDALTESTQTVAKLSSDHEADRDRFSKSFDSHTASIKALVEETGSGLREVLTKLNEDGNKLTQTGDMVGRVSADLAETLAAVNAKLSSVTGESAAPARAGPDRSSDILGRIDTISAESGEALEEIRAVLESSQTKSLTMITALQRVVQKLDDIGEKIGDGSDSAEANQKVARKLVPSMEIVRSMMIDLLEKANAIPEDVAARLGQIGLQDGEQARALQTGNDAVLEQLDAVRTTMNDLVQATRALPEDVTARLEQALPHGEPENDNRGIDEVLAPLENVRAMVEGLAESTRALPTELACALQNALPQNGGREDAGPGIGGEILVPLEAVRSSVADLVAAIQALPDTVADRLQVAGAEGGAVAPAHLTIDEKVLAPIETVRAMVEGLVETTRALPGEMTRQIGESLPAELERTFGNTAIDERVTAPIEAVRVMMAELIETTRALPIEVANSVERGALGNDGPADRRDILEPLEGVRSMMTDLAASMQTLPGVVADRLADAVRTGTVEAAGPSVEEAVLEPLQSVQTMMSKLTETVEALPGRMTDALDQSAHANGALVDPAGAANAQEVLDELRQSVEKVNIRLSEGLEDLSRKIGETLESGRKTDMAGLVEASQQIEGAARSVFERLDSLSIQALNDHTAQVHETLAHFARDLKEAANGGDDTLNKATKDIKTLAEVIDLLEERSAALARQMMELPSGQANSNAPISPEEYRETESAITALTAATEKLSNIATAVAIASDASQLSATG